VASIAKDWIVTRPLEFNSIDFVGVYLFVRYVVSIALGALGVVIHGAYGPIRSINIVNIPHIIEGRRPGCRRVIRGRAAPVTTSHIVGPVKEMDLRVFQRLVRLSVFDSTFRAGD
jgi:hypothetical protein